MKPIRAIVLLLCALSSLLEAQPRSPLSIAPTLPGQMRLDWTAAEHDRLQMVGSADLSHWEKVGPVVLGSGALQSAVLDNPAPKYFYQLLKGGLRPGFDGVAMGRWDDHTYPQYAVPGIEGDAEPVNLGFTINFFGELYSTCYVNNNGNISFGGSYGIFTPEPLRNLGKKIIAPFWADVDTSNVESDVVRFTSGNEFVNGRPTFGVTYRNVGYYNEQSDKLNSFQLLIIERSDTGLNNFDIEFNYDRIRWEAGDASHGVKGYGGSTARAGVTNGGTFSVELDGSGVPSAFLDCEPNTEVVNTSRGLVYRSHNSNVPGRFIFPVRDGVLEGTFNVNAGPDQQLPENHSAVVQLHGEVTPSNLTGLTYRWVQKDDLARVTFSDPTVLNPTVTLAQPGNHIFELTATSPGLVRFSVSDTVSVSHKASLSVDAGETVFRVFPDSPTITLHGTATYSGGGTVDIRWTQEYGEAAAIENANSLEPTVTLPGPGFFGFKIEATAAQGPFTNSSETTVNYYKE